MMKTFCSANPLRHAALADIEGCLRLPGMISWTRSCPQRRTSRSSSLIPVFAAAAEREDARMANMSFDVSANVTAEATPADGALVAQRIRQVGVRPVLYGSTSRHP
jgi:hypothetical protein